MFAQIISQSVVWYLGRYPLSSDSNEEKIRLYGRQLINQIVIDKEAQSVYEALKQKKVSREKYNDWKSYILESKLSDLIKAIVKNDYKQFKQALKDGADVNMPEGKRRKYTPLNLALMFQRHPAFIEDLIEAGADIDKNAPLIVAVNEANELGAMTLINKGANIHIQYDDENLISMASHFFCPRVVNYIIEKTDVDPNMDLGSTPSVFHYAASFGLINIMKKYFNKGIRLILMERVV